MSRYKIREATQGDLVYLASNLRAADMRELYAMHGHLRAKELLELSRDHSDTTLVGCDTNNTPVVIFGITKTTERAALIWAVATPEVTNYKLEFLRASRRILRGWFDDNPSLEFMYNFTHSENTVHHAWLTWVGATLMPPVPFGITGQKFNPFIIQRKDRYV